MRPCLLSLLTLMVLACSPGPYMTRQAYSDIQIGTAISTVEQQVGKAYEVRDVSGGKEYLYIERIDIAPQVTEQVNYYLTVQNGRVVGKHMERIDGPFPFKYHNP